MHKDHVTQRSLKAYTLAGIPPLCKRTLPFDAQDRHGHIDVAALVPVQECPYLELYGLFYRGMQGRQMLEMPLAELEAVQDGGENQQLLADYRWWFGHSR